MFYLDFGEDSLKVELIVFGCHSLAAKSIKTSLLRSKEETTTYDNNK